MSHNVEVEKGEDFVPKAKPNRREEFHDINADDVINEVRAYDQHSTKWSNTAYTVQKIVLNAVQYDVENHIGMPGTAILLQVKDLFDKHPPKTKDDLLFSNMSAVRFKTTKDEMIYALRLSVDEPNDYAPSEDELALLEEFGISEQPANYLAFYFPIQEAIIFDNLTDFAPDFLGFGFINNFDQYNLDDSGLPDGSSWVLDSRQIASLMGI